MRNDSDERIRWSEGFVALLIMVVVGAGVWVATMAVLENIRFSKGSQQILDVIANVRMYATHEKTAVVQSESDLFLQIFRAQRNRSINTSSAPATIENIWKQPMTARLVMPGMLARVEIGAPNYVCRRLVEFFAKNAVGLNLLRMEARSSQALAWAPVHEMGHGQAKARNTAAVAVNGCGSSGQAQLALVFPLQ